MTYLYTIHGINCRPLWRISKRRQGRQTRFTVDAGWWWVSVYVR